MNQIQTMNQTNNKGKKGGGFKNTKFSRDLGMRNNTVEN